MLQVAEYDVRAIGGSEYEPFGIDITTHANNLDDAEAMFTAACDLRFHRKLSIYHVELYMCVEDKENGYGDCISLKEVTYHHDVNENYS